MHRNIVSAEIFHRGDVVYSAQPVHTVEGGGVIEYWLVSVYPDPRPLGLFRVDVPPDVGEERRRELIIAEHERLLRGGGPPLPAA